MQNTVDCLNKYQKKLNNNYSTIYHTDTTFIFNNLDEQYISFHLQIKNISSTGCAHNAVIFRT